MFHLAAFNFTASNTGAGVFVTVPAVLDSWLTTNVNNRFILPAQGSGFTGPARLRMGYVQGTGTTVARVFNAYMRRINLPRLEPVRAGASVDTAFNVIDFGLSGPIIPASDEFGIEADNTGANVQTGLLWVHDGNENLPVGERFSVGFIATNAGSTTTLTTVANTWTAGNIVFNQSLPPGRYAIIGMDLVGATAIAARLINPASGPRPGILARASAAIYPQNQFRMGNLGTLMEFESYSQPLIEVFDSAAAAIAFTGVLDVVKIR